MRWNFEESLEFDAFLYQDWLESEKIVLGLVVTVNILQENNTAIPVSIFRKNFPVN